jgi:cellulose synthase/poly-beta-1,6-N-acetylglucosamine synthase-like glycosyltransferase
MNPYCREKHTDLYKDARYVADCDAIMNHPLASVIVPTFNSGRTICKSLDSIRRRSHPSVEIIVADNFSTDLSGKLSAQFGASAHYARLGMRAARNLGIGRSKAQYVLSLDSDLVVPATGKRMRCAKPSRVRRYFYRSGIGRRRVLEYMQET